MSSGRTCGGGSGNSCSHTTCPALTSHLAGVGAIMSCGLTHAANSSAV